MNTEKVPLRLLGNAARSQTLVTFVYGGKKKENNEAPSKQSEDGPPSQGEEKSRGRAAGRRAEGAQRGERRTHEGN